MRRALLSVAVVLVLGSCSKESDQENILKNDKFIPISLTKAQSEIAMNVNSLGFDVLSEILSDTESGVAYDLMISPLSLSSALAMCVNGADGSTKDQMLDLLGIQNGDIADLNSYYTLMLDALVRADRKVDFISVSSLWYNPLITLKDEYIMNVSETFDAEIGQADFSDASSVDRINNWCSSKTNGMIPIIMKKPEPDILVKLLNALYFKGMWKDAFEETKNKPFTHENGNVSTEKTIVDLRSLNCAETSSFKCVEIPYGNGAYVMDLLLPSEGVSITDAAKLLSEGGWDEISKKLSYKAVQIEFPTFEVTYDQDFSEILLHLGMIDAFSADADFSNMSDVSLMITSVSQFVSISVTEKGTEASAITDVTMGVTSPDPDSGPEEIFEFIANRPFFFMIRESSTGTILFIGKKA